MHLRNDIFSKLEFVFKSSIFIRVSGIGLSSHCLLPSLVKSCVVGGQWASVGWLEKDTFTRVMHTSSQRPHRKMFLEHTKRAYTFEEQKKCTELFSVTFWVFKSWLTFIAKQCPWGVCNPVTADRRVHRRVHSEPRALCWLTLPRCPSLCLFSFAN